MCTVNHDHTDCYFHNNNYCNFQEQTKTRIHCPKCNKKLLRDLTNRTEESALKAHLKRCYFCEHCKSFRAMFTGHSDQCQEYVQYQREIGKERGYHPCPICNIPFHHRLEHIQKTHNIYGEELLALRLVAERASNPAERNENSKSLATAIERVSEMLCTL